MTVRPEREVAPFITEVIREAREAWPGVEVPEATFAAFLSERGIQEKPSGLHVGDLYLACACAASDPGALAAFERAFMAPLPGVVARAGLPAQLGVEATQRLRERLFVGDARRPPRIAAYQGRAGLAGWLRVAAIREAVMLQEHENVHARLRPDEPAPPATPEEAAIRARYGALFESAFAEAFRALPADDRLALRLHFVDGLNLDALAVTFGFSRATAGRRLLLARTRLRDETMRLVGVRLGASATEVESVLKVLQSGLEVSFGALVTAV